MVPVSLSFSSSRVVSFPMAFLIYPKALLVLNLGPKTGRLGRA